jgi:ArsR family transcriptional regulator
MPKNAFTCDCHAVNHQLVAEVQTTMPETAVFDRVAAFYKIMGDTTRCKLIWALRQGEMCVCDLASLLSMTKSAISHQLRKLREFDVVRCRREGKEVYYCLNDDHIAQIFAVTMTHVKECSHEK